VAADHIRFGEVFGRRQGTLLELGNQRLQPLDLAVNPGQEGGRLVGMVTRGSAVTVPERDRERVTARQLMVPAETLEPASLEDDGASLLQRLEGEGLVAVPVVSGGEVLGLVGRASLLHLLERRGRR